MRKIFNEIIAESFSKLGKEMNIWIQEAYRTPNGLNQKRKYSITLYIKCPV
jgi:hypothetical protein